MSKYKVKKVWDFPTNFTYNLKVDFDYTECTPECYNSNDYCRCKRIINTKIRDLNPCDIFEYIVNNGKSKRFYNNDESFKNLIQNKPFFRYALERILTHFKYYDIDSYEIEIRGGYYGEELGETTFTKQSKVVDHLQKCLNSKNPIEYLLKLEYGYIPNHLKDQEWKEDTILFSQIIRPKDLIKVPSYEWSLDIPIGIYEQTPLGYKIIDGHHRYALSQKEELVDVIYTKLGY